MQPRSAVILSLGMLHEKVDSSLFIGKLLKKASDTNKEFKWTPELQVKAFGLSEIFNQGKIEPEMFHKNLTSLLGITVEKEEFWKEWNAMIILGKVADKIKLLEACAKENKALFYLNTDTNIPHLQEIASAYKEMKIPFDASKNPVLLDEIPLYVSCQIKKNRNDLIKEIYSKIKEKEFKVEKITLIFGDPENVKDKAHQMMAKKEFDQISKWCEENHVSICLHNNAATLKETLNQIFHPAEKNEDDSRLSVSMG